jgi:hypothetical protein
METHRGIRFTSNDIAIKEENNFPVSVLNYYCIFVY